MTIKYHIPICLRKPNVLPGTAALPAPVPGDPCACGRLAFPKVSFALETRFG